MFVIRFRDEPRNKEKGGHARGLKHCPFNTFEEEGTMGNADLSFLSLRLSMEPW